MDLLNDRDPHAIYTFIVGGGKGKGGGGEWVWCVGGGGGGRT